MAYMLMLAYLIIMLSRWDPVHSMVGMSFVVDSGVSRGNLKDPSVFFTNHFYSFYL
eukprot:COSAG05_NODE_3026_length_2407_cov_6.052860_3_plen_56_part_00